MEETSNFPTSVLKRFDFIIIAVIVYLLNSCSTSSVKSELKNLQEEVVELKTETIKLREELEETRIAAEKPVAN